MAHPFLYPQCGWAFFLNYNNKYKAAFLLAVCLCELCHPSGMFRNYDLDLYALVDVSSCCQSEITNINIVTSFMLACSKTKANQFLRKTFDQHHFKSFHGILNNNQT